jgi:hypothetical protein
MAKKRKVSGKISDILLDHGILNEEALSEAENEARAKGIRLEKYLTENKLVNSVDMVLALAEYLKMPPITLAHFVPNPELIQLIPRETMAKHLIIPVARMGHNLTIAMGDPFDLMAIDEIGTLTSLDITPLAAPDHEISSVLSKLFEETSQGFDMEELMRDSDSDVEILEAEEGDEHDAGRSPANRRK